jgi:hypothetical protein
VVDTKGRVTEASTGNRLDSLYEEHFQPFFRSIRFEPGKLEGKKITQTIPAQVFIRHDRKRPEMWFPVDSAGEVSNAFMYAYTLSLNGIQLPEIKSFPSYFCDLGNDTSLVRYPFLLARLELDKTGTPTLIEEVLSTYPAFSRQTLSAINYGEYSPIQSGRNPSAATQFLLVSFFPQMNYPTEPIDSSGGDSISMPDRLRVRLLPDTVHLLSPPVPRNFAEGSFAVTGAATKLGRAIYSTVGIDSSGFVTPHRVYNVPNSIRRIVTYVLKQLRFYPALTFQGEAVSFRGIVRLDFRGDPFVRITCFWLSDIR